MLIKVGGCYSDVFLNRAPQYFLVRLDYFRFIQYSMLKVGIHNWKDLYIQVSNQQTCTLDNRGGGILNLVLVDVS